jgi:hypothetical protein
MVLQNILYAPDMETYAPSNLELFLVMLNFPSVFILWFWMVSDYFKHSTKNRKVWWGWFLLFGSVLAAIIYFFFQWRPRFANNS